MVSSHLLSLGTGVTEIVFKLIFFSRPGATEHRTFVFNVRMFVRVRRTFEQTNIDLGDELKNIRTLNNRTFENHRTFEHANIRTNEHPNTRTFEHLKISEHSI